MPLSGPAWSKRPSSTMGAACRGGPGVRMVTEKATLFVCLPLLLWLHLSPLLTSDSSFSGFECWLKARKFLKINPPGLEYQMGLQRCCASLIELAGSQPLYCTEGHCWPTQPWTSIPVYDISLHNIDLFCWYCTLRTLSLDMLFNREFHRHLPTSLLKLKKKSNSVHFLCVTHIVM